MISECAVWKLNGNQTFGRATPRCRCGTRAPKL